MSLQHLFFIDVQCISAVFLEVCYHKELQLSSSRLNITCTCFKSGNSVFGDSFFLP